MRSPRETRFLSLAKPGLAALEATQYEMFFMSSSDGAVAGSTHCGVAGLAFDEIRLGRFGGIARRIGRKNRCCQCGSRQQRGEQLHIEGLCLCAQNLAILQ